MTKAPRIVDLAREYIGYLKSLGFQFTSAEPLLLRFAEYADQIGHRGPLTTELAVRWARLPSAGSPGYIARRLDVVRGFARYRAIADPRTEIPSIGLLGTAYRRRTPHIYSDAELAALLDAARRLPPSTGLKPHTYATLFGLLACTGLRVSEALKLTRSDIDWRQGLLTIRQTKFRKSRLVPLHPSTIGVLREYADRRDRFHPYPTAEEFFLTRRDTPLSLGTVGVTFWNLRKQLRWSTGRGLNMPRIHDLRHNRHLFAVHTLRRWYQTGQNLDAKLPLLATYLGHQHLSGTQRYLHLTAELFPEITARLDAAFGEVIPRRIKP